MNKAQRLTQFYEFNIAMLNSPGSERQHAELTADYEMAKSWMAGLIDWAELPWRIKEVTYTMPDWATRGT
jgi:hypothetical protein